MRPPKPYVQVKLFLYDSPMTFNISDNWTSETKSSSVTRKAETESKFVAKYKFPKFTSFMVIIYEESKSYKFKNKFFKVDVH